MTDQNQNSPESTIVALDIAKRTHDAAIQYPSGKRATMKVQNSLEGFQRLLEVANQGGSPINLVFEATADYHRNIAYWFAHRGAQCFMVSSLSCARAREMLFQTWDKNDRKDAQVVLYLMRQGMAEPFHDPLITGILDIQELSNTYHQISLARSRCLHSLVNHYLCLYFPEMERFLYSARAEWFCRFLLKFPTPTSVTRYRKPTFVKRAWKIVGKKPFKQQYLEGLYETAEQSIGLPINPKSVAEHTFKLQVQRFLELTKQRKALEDQAHHFLSDRDDYCRLRTIPGVGPIIAMMIIAESGDLRRFGHYKQYLNFCGFNLSAVQSGQRSGTYRLSKRGNARLRYAYWLAATVAIRQRENSFRHKYERYIRANSDSADAKRKAYVAVATKIARVAHALVKQGSDYRGYYEFSHGT